MGIRMSKLVISVSALTAATIVWYSLPCKKRGYPRQPKYPILGLANVGSSCFLNAILQAFASLQYFERWLDRKDIDNNISKDEIPKKFEGLKYPVIAILYRTVLVVNRVVQKDEYVLASRLPVLLTNVLRRRGQNILLNEEQDAVEIMQLIFAAVNDDVMTYSFPEKKGTLACFEFETNQEDILIDQIRLNTSATDDDGKSDPYPKMLYQQSTEHISVAYRVHGQPVIKLAETLALRPTIPFKGLIASKLECIACYTKNPISTESFDVLSLSLPTTPVKAISLNKLINDYLKPTMVHGVDCDACSKKAGHTIKSSFCKSLAFGRLPKVLCFHIMRTSWSGSDNRLSKRLDQVVFPVKLDMRQFKSLKDLSIKPSNVVANTNHNQITKESIIRNMMRIKPLTLDHWDPYYELRAVICHEGDIDNGHYITLRKCPTKKNTWYNVSDDVVTTVPEEYVLACRAYVLFYEYVPAF